MVAANDAGSGVECNPVTNTGCTGGKACDQGADATSGDFNGFICYPPPNTATVCQSCDFLDVNNGPFCGPGLTCEALTMDGTVAVCAQYCCTDADCGSAGTCVTSQMGTSLFGPIAPSIGICVAGVFDAGAPILTDAATADATVDAAHD